MVSIVCEREGGSNTLEEEGREIEGRYHSNLTVPSTDYYFYYFFKSKVCWRSH